MECALCTENFKYFGLPQCEHKTICSLCWYRMRSLLNNKSCPLCRQTSEHLFITSNLSIRHSDLIATIWNESVKGFNLDLQSQIYFENPEELQRLITFKNSNCKICSLECKNFNMYKDHLYRFHAKRICEVCSMNNNLFPSEQEVYEEVQLGIHKMSHHVQCELCFDYYYDQRKLLDHIKSQHFFCELCDVVKRTAYRSYQDLEAHYRQFHYLCEVSGCRNELHIVFMCYDDLKDHYRSNHPGLAIPQPVCAFKIKDEEEKQFMIFEDVSSKNYEAPKISEENKDFIFPALGGTVPERKNVLDYSRINKNSAPKQNSLFPSSFFPATESVPGSVFPAKKQKHKKKPEQSELSKSISRLNNNHITLDEFLDKLKQDTIEPLPETISIIRAQVASNSFKEKIVQELERFTKQNKKPEASKRNPEEFKTPSRPNTKPSESFDRSSFPALGNVQPIKVKSEFNTLLENIAIYNNRLISAKCFVENLLEFMPRTEVNTYKATIKEKVRQDGRAEVLNLLERTLLMTSNESEYPALVPAKPVYQKTWNENIRENLKLLNEGMMTTKEFIVAACKALEEANVPDAVKLIKSIILNSAQANRICKDVLEHFGMNDYKDEFPVLITARIPPEPKRRK